MRISISARILAWFLLPLVAFGAVGVATVWRMHRSAEHMALLRRGYLRVTLKIGQIDAIKTHNPFAVNDVYFSRETGVAIEDFNRYGSSLIFGHPQGPTGTRLIIELIEELAIRGGG